MAPKRKLKPEEENTTDEETITTTSVTKKGRQTNAFSKLMDASKPKPTTLKFDLQWSNLNPESKDIPELYYLHSLTLDGCKKIASFDIDNTIIATKSGKNFATGPSDWKWWSDQVIHKLKELNKGKKLKMKFLFKFLI